MDTKLKLPEGFKAVEHYNDPMIGDMLVVKLKNGFTVVIDALSLGDHEAQIGVYKPEGWDGDKAGDIGSCVAGVYIDPNKPVEAVVFS